MSVISELATELGISEATLRLLLSPPRGDRRRIFDLAAASLPLAATAQLVVDDPTWCCAERIPATMLAMPAGRPRSLLELRGFYASAELAIGSSGRAWAANLGLGGAVAAAGSSEAASTGGLGLAGHVAAAGSSVAASTGGLGLAGHVAPAGSSEAASTGGLGLAGHVESPGSSEAAFALVGHVQAAGLVECVTMSISGGGDFAERPGSPPLRLAGVSVSIHVVEAGLTVGAMGEGVMVASACSCCGVSRLLWVQIDALPTLGNLLIPMIYNGSGHWIAPLPTIVGSGNADLYCQDGIWTLDWNYNPPLSPPVTVTSPPGGDSFQCCGCLQLSYGEDLSIIDAAAFPGPVKIVSCPVKGRVTV